MKIRESLRRIVFEADTPMGKAFDVGLLITIILSTLAVMLESVTPFGDLYGHWLIKAEWFFTIAFTIEYLVRILTCEKPLKYLFSFYGLVDLVAILPSYLGLFIEGGYSFLLIRSIRLLRIFRVFKLVQFVWEGRILRNALVASRRKITVFIGAVLVMVTLIGTLMYLVEGESNGFTDIPTSVYWAIVTMTTVGYGDIAPQTPLGKMIASVVMLLGYGIIAIPTGIVSAEIAQSNNQSYIGRHCQACNLVGHETSAIFCRRCGAELHRQNGLE